MNMANTGLTAWYPLDEAAEAMSRHIGANIHRHALLGAALTNRLPLVVCVPSGTKDSEGQPIDEGLWDLLLEGSRGQQARQQLAHEISPDIPNVDGMWVETGGKHRQLRPAGYPDTSHGVIPDECVLGVLETVLDDFAEKTKDKLPPRLFKESPTPPAPKSESVQAELKGQTPPKSAKDLDKSLGTRERETLLIIINALVRKSKIDMSNPTRAAKTIVAEVELFGGKMHWQTVDDKLKQVKELIKWLETQEIK